MNQPAPIARIIGETENALRAMLTGIVASTPIRTYDGYVCLSLVTNAGIGAETLRQQLGRALGVTEGQASAIINEAIADNLLERSRGQSGTIVASDLGRETLSDVRREIGAVNLHLHEGIPEDDLDASRRTLTIIQERARIALSRRTA